MPTLKLPPDSNVTSEPPASSSHWYHPGLSRFHIYLALGAAVASVVIFRFAAARRPKSQRSTTPFETRNEKATLNPQDGQASDRKDSQASYTTDQLSAQQRNASETPCAEERQEPRDSESLLGGGQTPPGQFIWASGLLGPPVPAGNWGSGGPLAAAQAMDGRGSQQRDDSSGPEHSASRGVSISPSAADHLLRRQQNPSPAGVVSGSHSQRRNASRSPGSPFNSTSRRHSGSSDGITEGQRPKGKGKGKDKNSEHTNQGPWPAIYAQEFGHQMMAPQHSDDSRVAPSFGFVGVDYTTAIRPPPPPPLTPPTLSTSTFKFEDRRPGYAVSIPPQLDTTFIHQPNPDYHASSTSADVMSSSPKSATSNPGTRRRSYNKSVPIGIPNASSASSHDSSMTLTSADTFSPASYPPTSPLLPPPPPGHEFGYDTHEYAFDDPNAPPVVGAHGEIDLQGEIISVMDHSGRGWKRHTRVYGGGVCLACVAAGGESGGFYGDKVPPEQRR